MPAEVHPFIRKTAYLSCSACKACTFAGFYVPALISSQKACTFAGIPTSLSTIPKSTTTSIRFHLIDYNQSTFTSSTITSIGFHLTGLNRHQLKLLSTLLV